MNTKIITNAAKSAVGKIKFTTIKYAPEMLVVTGIASGAAAIFFACKATLKVSKELPARKKVILNKRDQLKIAEESEELEEKALVVKEKKKELCKEYIATGANIAKEYSIAAAFAALSTTCVLSSMHILKLRSAAVAAAYTALDNAFKKYRKNVIDRFGESAEKDIYLDKHTDEVEEEVINKKGETKKVKKKVTSYGPNLGSPYARFFDESSLGWRKDAESNLKFLRDVQCWANDKLRCEKYLFLNDVYKALGIPPTKAGQQVGWIYNAENEVGDNYVDFGIYDISSAEHRAFVNGYERNILLDFNVDGPILHRMNWEE